ncbi:MAG: AbrB family transcriptional regulator [Stygiobacter sp. RIFOXYC12_FULL_38_8]|nr:MAG: AbrB family transcriptional regulator [Stygiobacter sp.]KAF0210295.1 MAG: AbrB family transcriptional [Ignavibacteria bacterium]OGU65118.1 MAG: AbrB family transcriptional regulator [Stygiobacter sp. GWC2_38_9]OGV08959.1 MAG: AbrB family transcriptional regulator [Stygiobacter sp. RIFOXYB2_FULL_37_11]OGV11239.1 MAG: AbrB family transcriptional regulator [Stygiobacter sp. RIFOXYA2_FULL_38_8]OGV12108.1 MAG: AbrB family transcriptional regulator [Stygiobacter sp. RIFOXYC2_FULL_38_25]OGV2
MTTVKISPKYQVVIPKEIRNKLKLKPGQRMQILQFGERIEFILLKNIKEARGFLKGIDTSIEREEDRL